MKVSELILELTKLNKPDSEVLINTDSTKLDPWYMPITAITEEDIENGWVVLSV